MKRSAMLAAMLPLLAAAGAQAQGLAAYATPPRFEVKGEPGKTQRHILEIQHGGREPGRFRIYTHDWEFQPDFSVKFNDALGP